MYTIDVTLSGINNDTSDYVVELLKEAGSDSCGNTFDVSANKDKEHVLISFEKNVPQAHEAYFDVVHELTDAGLVDNVVSIERVF